MNNTANPYDSVRQGPLQLIPIKQVSDLANAFAEANSPMALIGKRSPLASTPSLFHKQLFEGAPQMNITYCDQRILHQGVTKEELELVLAKVAGETNVRIQELAEMKVHSVNDSLFLAIEAIRSMVMGLQQVIDTSITSMRLELEEIKEIIRAQHGRCDALERNLAQVALKMEESQEKQTLTERLQELETIVKNYTREMARTDENMTKLIKDVESRLGKAEIAMTSHSRGGNQMNPLDFERIEEKIDAKIKSMYDQVIFPLQRDIINARLTPTTQAGTSWPPGKATTSNTSTAKVNLHSAQHGDPDSPKTEESKSQASRTPKKSARKGRKKRTKRKGQSGSPDLAIQKEDLPGGQQGGWENIRGKVTDIMEAGRDTYYMVVKTNLPIPAAVRVHGNYLQKEAVGQVVSWTNLRWESTDSAYHNYEATKASRLEIEKRSNPQGSKGPRRVQTDK